MTVTAANASRNNPLTLQQPIIAVDQQQQSSSNKENKSASTITTAFVPYYGSREPKQSIAETDRVIFQMMDDIQLVKLPTEKQEYWNSKEKLKQYHHTKNRCALFTLWKFRVLLSAVIILMIVVATIIISELTKAKFNK